MMSARIGVLGAAVSALLEQVAACWPGERPVHLVADRGFPGQRLFRTLKRLRWGWTVRQSVPPSCCGAAEKEANSRLRRLMCTRALGV